MKATRGRFRETHLRNKDLRAIYKYLNEDITQVALSKAIGRSRTNTYYYIGRAVHYWINSGSLKWRKGVKGGADLGGEKPVRKSKPKENT